MKSPNGVAIAAILASTVLYTLSDAGMKLAAAVPPGERVFVRSIGVVLVLTAAAWWMGELGQLRLTVGPLLVQRALGDAGNSLFFQAALGRMPLADAMGILQLTPLGLTAAAALFLHAQVGWRRWLAVGVGFAGTLCVIKPGMAAFNPWGLAVIVSIAASVWRDLATRRFAAEISPLAILLASQIGVGALSFGGLLVEDWSMPSTGEVASILLGAVLFAGGHLAAIYAVRESDWAVIAPFRYAGIVWGVMVGFLIWGDFPDALSWLGIMLLIGAGLYTLHRERVLSRRSRARD